MTRIDGSEIGAFVLERSCSPVVWFKADSLRSREVVTVNGWRPGRHAAAVLGTAVLCAGLVVAEAGVAAAAPPLVGFGPHTDYPVGATPTMGAVADLNGDTIRDLVVANGNA